VLPVSEALTGRLAVEEYAPTVAPVLDRLEQTAGIGLPTALVDDTAHTVAAVHLATPRPVFAEPHHAALRFAEQFTVDVSSLDADTRKAMLAALGNDAFAYTQTAYLLDVIGRARLVLDALFGTSAPEAPGADPFDDLWSGIETFLAVVPSLQALDPVTTDLIRLRLAAHHNCRLCKSLRSYSALEADAAYDEVDVNDATRSALALVDAFAWTPARLGPGLVHDVRSSFTPAQQVEIVLDTARNAANKVAVALGADAPHVTSGYEVYDVAPDGSITYGMEHPGVR